MSSCSGSTRTERCIRFGSKPTKLPFLNGVFGRNGPYARSKWRAGPAFPRSFLEDATTSGGHVGEAQSPHPDVAITCPSGLWMNRRQPETTQKRACGKNGIPKCLRSQALSPHHRLVIALHSPDGVAETGLCVCPPEKSATKLAARGSTGHSLRCGLKARPTEFRRFSTILASNAARFLCNPDCVAEREGFNSLLFAPTRMNIDDNA